MPPPDWRPLSEAPALIRDVSAMLIPEIDALRAALASGKVSVRGSCLKDPVQQPIEHRLHCAQSIDPNPYLNELAIRVNGRKVEFWNVEVDRDGLTSYAAEYLAPRRNVAPGEQLAPMRHAPPVSQPFRAALAALDAALANHIPSEPGNRVTPRQRLAREVYESIYPDGHDPAPDQLVVETVHAEMERLLKLDRRRPPVSPTTIRRALGFRTR